MRGIPRCAVGRLTVLAAAGLLAGACGHSLGPGLAANHPDGFDFREPPCEPASAPAGVAAPWRAGGAAPDGEVTVLYLGAGGLYVGWRGEAVLFAPFFSNPGLFETGLSPMRWRWGAIGRGLEGVPLARVGAILAGHSHYDHIGDLPVVAGELAPWTRLYLNRSGANALAAYSRLRERTVVLEDRPGEWLRLADAADRPLPFRVRAVASEHAPHVDGITLWTGETEASPRPWRRRRYPELEAGRTQAFVLDLLGPAADGDEPEGGAVLFRIYYQDSASRASAGVPPPELRERPYDLAVTVLASAHLVKPYPKELLEAIRPRHVLAIHYEDFFRPWEERRGFVPLLTRRRAEAFLARVDEALAAGGQELAGPVLTVCGPSTDGWTVPLIEEWMAFRSSLQGSE